MSNNKTVAIAGLGAIGGRLARELLDPGLPGFHLVAAGARDLAKARSIVGDIAVVDLAELANHADIVRASRCRAVNPEPPATSTWSSDASARCLLYA